MREPYAVFLIIFLSAGIVPLFFGSWTIQTRIVYDMPFEIPAAISLYYISKRSGSILVRISWLHMASCGVFVYCHELLSNSNAGDAVASF